MPETRIRWNQTELEILKQLTEQGISCKEIAEKLTELGVKRTEDAVRSQITYRGYKRPEKEYKRWTEHDTGRLIKLRDTTDMNLKQIAEVMGFSTTTISTAITENGLQRRRCSTKFWEGKNWDKLDKLVEEKDSIESIAREFNKSERAIKSAMYIRYGSKMLRKAKRVLRGESIESLKNSWYHTIQRFKGGK